MKLLVALTETEWSLFFPGEMADQLRSLDMTLTAISPEKLSTQQWRQIIQKEQPEVILGAWGLPILPEDTETLTSGRLRYLCYLAGSVRQKIMRSHLEEGLIVTNWGDTISRTVAEGGLTLILAALRRLAHWQLAMHLEAAWRSALPDTGSLFERRVGIHGFGAIARALVPLLKPFDVHISTYSPSVPDSLLEELGVARASDLESLFSTHDVIVELAALTPRNRNSVGADLLRRITPGGVFVNIGRGRVVNGDDLVEVAREGKIMIGLDVFWEEPLPVDSPLRGMRNVVLTPHLAGPTTDRHQDSGRQAIQNLRRYQTGEPLLAAITPEIFDRST